MATQPLRVPSVRAAPARLRMRAARPAAPGAQPTTVDAQPSSHDALVATKKSLEAVSLKLNGVDPADLFDPQRAIWADQMKAVDLAIARVRVSLLEGIVAQFEAQLPSIQQATARLEADLASLQQALDIINAVAGVFGVIGQIIELAG